MKPGGPPASNSNSQPTQVRKDPPLNDAPEWAVTLPVLYVFLSDDSLVNQLKVNHGLTEEQITKLKSIGREATDRLRDAEIENRVDTRSPAELRAESVTKIKEIIGEEKTAEVLKLVAQRWRGNAEVADAALTRPNAVPTDSRIVVNTPAFRMDVFENGHLVKSYMVGIGYPEFPLPTGLRYAESIIFNPSWTPPDAPWVERAANVEAGEVIKPGDKRNPLGVMKVPIGLPSLIHGGKSVAQLGNLASHGCVGLTNEQAKDFAKVLARLGEMEITDEQIAQYEKNRTETKTIKLRKPIPVELRYETAVIEDGKLRIYRDVYDRKTNTEEELRAALSSFDVSFDRLTEQERAQVATGLREMSRDASGRLDVSSQQDASKRGTPERKTAKESADQKKNRVTRAIKGQKEVVIEIAALKGKGYPTPTTIDMGKAGGS
jgi:lipoprotein-anchoring transpeptidase ErfK/SrfK